VSALGHGPPLPQRTRHRPRAAPLPQASKVAASAVLLSLYTLQRHPWTPTLAHYTQYPASQLADCARRLWVLFRSARLPSALPAVRDKYSAPRFKCVSKLMHPHELPGHIFSD